MLMVSDMAQSTAPLSPAEFNYSIMRQPYIVKVPSKDKKSVLPVSDIILKRVSRGYFLFSLESRPLRKVHHLIGVEMGFHSVNSHQAWLLSISSTRLGNSFEPSMKWSDLQNIVNI